MQFLVLEDGQDEILLQAIIEFEKQQENLNKANENEILILEDGQDEILLQAIIEFEKQQEILNKANEK